MSGNMTLQNVRNTQLNVVGVLSHHIIRLAVRHCGRIVLLLWMLYD